MKHKLMLTVAILIAVSFVLSPLMQAEAVVVLSNRPWGSTAGWCVGSNGVDNVAMRFSVPAADAYVLNSVTIMTHEVAGGSPYTLALHDDSMGAAQPGNLIAVLGNLTGGGPQSHLEYTFPGGGNLLAAGTTYWLVMSTTDPASCDFGWQHSAAVAPAGIFTYLDTVRHWNGAWITGATPVDVEIDADLAGEDLMAYAVCDGDDLEINITGGDLSIDVYESGAYVGTADALGKWYILGPGVFNDVTLMELGGDMQSLNLGSFNCPSYGVPNLGLVQINATAGLQPYGMPGMEMQNFVLPADFDGNGFDTYIVTDVELVDGEYWLGLFIGSGDWVYVPYSAVIPLTPIAGIN